VLLFVLLGTGDGVAFFLGGLPLYSIFAFDDCCGFAYVGLLAYSERLID